MPSAKYTFFICQDCGVDFLVSCHRRKTFCPVCGDDMAVKIKRNIWIDRPFTYNRKWTEEEDKVILSGVRDGKSYPMIVSELNDRTEHAVKCRLRRLRKKKEGHG
jgi:hypothetical protein